MLTPLLGTLPTYSKAVVHDPSLTVQSSLSTDAHDAGSSSGTTVEVKDFKHGNGTHSSCRCDWTTIDDVCQQGRNRSQICSTMCCALEEQVRTGDGAQQQDLLSDNYICSCAWTTPEICQRAAPTEGSQTSHVCRAACCSLEEEPPRAAHIDAPSPQPCSTAPRPSIALIIADDLLRLSLASYTSDKRFQQFTPNLNALAQRPGAAVVQRAYSTSALCTPSRVSLLTGRYASRLWGGRHSVEGVSMIEFCCGPSFEDFRSYETIPRLLSGCGYITGFLGKWHTGLWGEVLGSSARPAPMRLGVARTWRSVATGSSDETETLDERCDAQCAADPLSAECATNCKRVEEGRAAISEDEIIRKMPVREAAIIRELCGNVDDDVGYKLLFDQRCMSELVKYQGGFDHAAEVYYDTNAMVELGHHPESMAAAAVKFVRGARSASRPFFLWMASTLPHPPSDFFPVLNGQPKALDKSAPPPPWDTVSEWSKLRKSVLQRVVGSGWPFGSTDLLVSEIAHVGAAWLDATLAPVLRELEAANTLTIFTSDHGHDVTGKGSLYEGGVQVPLFVHWSEHPACTAWASSAIFTHLDLMPTLAAVAGVRTPREADGRDLSAELWPGRVGATCQTDTDKWQRLFTEVGFGRAITRGKWKLIRVPRPGEATAECLTWFGDKLGDPAKADLTRLVFQSYQLHASSYCNETQLFDLEADPLELHNLAATQPERVAKMAQTLQEHVAADGSGEDVLVHLSERPLKYRR